MLLSRPYFAEAGPAINDPNRPPNVKIENTRPTWAAFIGIHRGKLKLSFAVRVLFSHVMMDFGTFSSAYDD